MQTQVLKLNKPISGASNWGNAVNRNWDIIDNEYTKMNNNLHSIEERMSDFGTFSFINALLPDGNTYEAVDRLLFCKGYVAVQVETDIKYYEIGGELPEPVEDEGIIKWVYDVTGQSSIEYGEIQNKINVGSCIFGHTEMTTVGSNSIGHFVRATEGSTYSQEYYNNNNILLTQFYGLADFTAFYIEFPYIKTNDGIFSSLHWYAFGIEWSGGEILIKSSRIENNVKTTNIQRLRQVLGGYYVPTSSPNQPNTLIFNKRQSSEAQSEVKITIPHNVYNGVETVVQVEKSADKYKDISTNIKSEIYVEDDQGNKIYYINRITNIYFFIGNEIERTPILISYTIFTSENIWYIRVDTTYLPDDGCYVAYTVNQFLKEE